MIFPKKQLEKYIQQIRASALFFFAKITCLIMRQYKLIYVLLGGIYYEKIYDYGNQKNEKMRHRKRA